MKAVKLVAFFVFGSSDMEIIGTQYDGTLVTVFKNGNFVI